MSSKYRNIKTLIKLTAISSGIIGLSNQFIIHQSTKTKILSRIPNKKYYKTDACNLFYTVNGSGSPILLIHDLNPGGSGYEWYKIVEELSKNHTVYTIDLPGCGRSEKKDMIYTDYYLSSVLAGFVKEVIQEKTDVIASGYSCFLPFSLERIEDPFIRKIVLINPYDFKKYTRIANLRDYIFHKILHFPLFGTLIYHLAVSRENIDNFFIESYYYNPFHLDTSLETAYYEASHYDNSKSKYIFSSMVMNYTGCNMDKYIRQSNKNIVLLMGESEPHFLNIIHQYQNANFKIQAFVISKSKHFPHIENIEDFYPVLSQSLS